MTRTFWWRLIFPILILWLGFGLRIYQIDFQSIWWDEGHSIFVAEHSIPNIPTLPAMDVHPPAYFSLLHLWMGLTGNSEFALRYLSTIFSILTIALLWRFAVTLSPASSSQRLVIGGLAALFTALSPFYIAYAQEVRSYTMITFLAVGSTFSLWQLIRQEYQRTWLITYILFTTACLYTHYFTIFLLLFQNLVWLIWVGQRSLTQQKIHWPSGQIWIVGQIVTFILFVPQLQLALRQVTTYTNPNLVPPSLSDFISHSWQAYTLGLTIEATQVRWGMWLIVGVLVIASALLFVRQRNRSQSNDVSIAVSFLLTWFLLPLLAYYLILQRQPSFEPRYMILITPSLFLFLALILSQLITKTTTLAYRATFYVFSGLIVISFAISLQSYFTNEAFFKDDSAGVAAWLAEETTANDVVYIDVPHPFHYYAERANIPAPTRYLFVDIHTAAKTLNAEAASKDRFFWVTWWGSDTDPRRVIPFLAEKRGRFVEQRDFRGYQVSQFNLESGQIFELPNQLTPLNATFGDVIQLDGLAYGETTQPGNPAWVTLHYTLVRDTDTNYKASLRLRDLSGQQVSQLDQDLFNDRHFRTADWPLHDPTLNQAINVYTLPVAPDVAPGKYQLELVIYNAEPPFPSEGVVGLPANDNVSAILGSIEISP